MTESETQIEQSVIGSMMADAANVATAMMLVKKEDFSDLRHAAIFESLCKSFDGEQFSEAQLARLVRECKGVDLPDGDKFDDAASSVGKCLNSVVSPAHLNYFTDLLLELSTRRKIGRLEFELAKIRRDDSVKTRVDLLTKCQPLFQDLENHVLRDDSEAIAIQELNARMRVKLKKYDSDDPLPDPIRTGISDIDDMVTIHKKNLVTIAARPSHGKSAMGFNWAHNMAIDGNNVLFFSLEMSAEEIHDRMACTRAGVDSYRMSNNSLDESERAKLHQASRDLDQCTLWFDDARMLSSQQIAARARVHQRKHGLDILFIDYLNEMQMDSTHHQANLAERIGTTVRSLKAMAKELDVPVILLCQLNRESEKDASNRLPRMTDLKDSGGIEEASDIILMIHHESKRSARRGEGPYEAKLVVEKQRNGATGIVELLWFPKITRFEQRAAKHFDNYTSEFDEF